MDEINEEFVFETMKSFFPLEWTSRESISFYKFASSGYVNRMWVVENSSAVQEPTKVLLRLYGNESGAKDKLIEDDIVTNETEEALILFEQSRRGNGPKLHGLIKGGRIEEFIESHTLTAEESKDLPIMADMAKAFARLHTLDLPIKRDRWKNWFKVPRIKREVYSSPEIISTGIDFESILSLDLEAETAFVLHAIEKVNSKFAFINHDSHYANVLVRHNVSPEDLRVVLVDYECLMYGPRGFDIACHFLCRMVDQKLVNTKINREPFPSQEERQFFMKEYLKELEKIQGYLDPQDNEEHLTMEVDVAILGWSLSFLMLIHSNANTFLGDVAFFSFPDFLYKIYVGHKPLVLDTYKFLQ